jgi:hypothetical protein
MTTMTAAEVQIEESEVERVERWRSEALEHAGYDSDSAALVAVRHDVDLHQAIEIVEQGCAPEIALRILL